jgi:hypothetical protein
MLIQGIRGRMQAMTTIPEHDDAADDDLAWAKPLVDEALAQVARGEFISLEEHRARNAARLTALKERECGSSSIFEI